MENNEVQEPKKEKIGVGQSIKDFFKGYVDFKGETSRREYWITFGMLVLLYVILIAIFGTLIGINADSVNAYGPIAVVGLIVIGFVMLGLLLPTIALNVRRSRDAGLRGRGYLVLYIINFAASYADVPHFYGRSTGMMSNYGYMMNGGYNYMMGGTNQILSFIGLVISLFLLVVLFLPHNEMVTKSKNEFVRFFLRSKD